MSLAVAQDVETSLMRSLSEQENEFVNRLLNRAENMIKVRIPNLLDRANGDSTFYELVAQIEAESVARVFRAGESGSGIYSSESEDGYSYQLNFKVASGLLDILPEEWGRLFGSGGFRTVAPVTDGYAQRRLGRPELRFQYGWPAEDDFSWRCL